MRPSSLQTFILARSFSPRWFLLLLALGSSTSSPLHLPSRHNLPPPTCLHASTIAAHRKLPWFLRLCARGARCLHDRNIAGFSPRIKTFCLTWNLQALSASRLTSCESTEAFWLVPQRRVKFSNCRGAQTQATVNICPLSLACCPCAATSNPNPPPITIAAKRPATLFAESETHSPASLCATSF